MHSLAQASATSSLFFPPLTSLRPVAPSVLPKVGEEREGWRGVQGHRGGRHSFPGGSDNLEPRAERRIARAILGVGILRPLGRQPRPSRKESTFVGSSALTLYTAAF